MNNTLNKKILSLPLWEFLLVLAVFIVMGVVLANAVGGPIFSDELQYMEIGLNNRKVMLVMNYYFHIFLQKPFLELAPTPLVGARIFWSVMITLTGFLIYISSRALRSQNSIFHSVLASVMFLSIPYLAEFSGRTIIDITAMALLTGIFTVYIFAARNSFTEPILLGLLGMLLFFTLRSKETAALAVYLVLGIGFQADGSYSIRQALRNLLPVFLGFLAGMAVMILLNAIVLKDALFGIRPSDLAAYYQTFSKSFEDAKLGDWFSSVLAKTLPLPFFLYLISGVKANKIDIHPTMRVLWIYPLLLLVLLILTLVFTTGWGVVPRNFLPGVPLLIILGVQAFHYEEPVNPYKKFLPVVYGLIGVGFYLLIRQNSHAAWLPENMNITRMSQYVLNPLGLLCIFAALFYIDKFNFRSISIPTIVLVLMLALPFYVSFLSLVRSGSNAERVNQIYYPFEAFNDEIQFSNEIKIYVSPSIPQNYNMLGPDISEIFSLFNVYFKEDSSSKNFIFMAKVDRKSGTLAYDDQTPYVMEADYAYAFLTADDWAAFQENSEVKALLEKMYAVKTEASGKLVLLVKKP